MKEKEAAMKYTFAPDLQARMHAIVEALAMKHIDIARVKCFRSSGSSTKRTLARCHTVGKLMQQAMDMPAHYAIEFLERFESLPAAEQDKVIIHELMHIPKAFGGGFRQHDYVCEENVNRLHAQFATAKITAGNISPDTINSASAPQRRLPRFF